VKFKHLWLIIVTVVIVTLTITLIHKRNVDAMYADFDVTSIHASKAPGEVIHHSIIKSFKQYRTGNTYYANLVVHTTQTTTLSLANWYLLEGKQSQPNQFLSENLTINGQTTNVLKKGTNVIHVNTNVDKNISPNLVVVTNPYKGKYNKFIFNTLKNE